MLQLNRDPAAARREAKVAVASNPESGLAHFLLSAASLGEDETVALDNAWAASLDPATAVAGRALVAQILSRRGDWDGVIAATSENRPLAGGSTLPKLQGLCHFQAWENQSCDPNRPGKFATDPLDTFALSVLWLAGEEGSQRLDDLLAGKSEPALDLASDYFELKQYAVALRIINKFYLDRVTAETRDPLPCYWARFLALKSADNEAGKGAPASALGPSSEGEFPYRLATVTVLRQIVQSNPNDGRAALYLGDVLFGLGRHTEAREEWKHAAETGADPDYSLSRLGNGRKEPERWCCRRAALVGEGRPGRTRRCHCRPRPGECPVRPRGQTGNQKRVN